MHSSHEHHAHEHQAHENASKESVFSKSIKPFLNKCWSWCAKIKNISLKTTVIIAGIIVLATLLFVYKDLFVVASVNGSFITRYSIIHELESKSGKAALENLILEKMVNMEAEKNGISVSEEDVDKEISNIASQIMAQGGTLEQALSMQGMTVEVLRGQIKLQKKMEALLGDKINVTESEIDTYIKDNKVTEQGDQVREQIRQQLKQEKVNSEAGSYLESLKMQSSIKYYIQY